MIDLTFRNINRLFVLSVKHDDNAPTRNLFDRHYMPLLEIKDFLVLINNKPFFLSTSKKKEINKVVEMSKNDNYTT